MNLRKAFLAAALFALTSSAIAAHCPMDMEQIDAALAAQPKLAAGQLTGVKKYRAEGEELHKAGKHQESVDALGKARTLLGI
ncbi:hypothetical protein [Povalibacter sp.]|uniref:hypothetical protein n=1 Tax=Povalibacter sp. TaxID=1962978 RepID=UPI002F3E6713